jgi:hypothetical protein
MRKFIVVLFLGMLTFSNSFAQTEILEDITTAFKNADQRLLSKYFGNKIEITLLDQSNVFSKPQAEMVMKDFFSKFNPTEFQILYKNNPSADAARFAIGQFETESGKFRIYFILKNIDNNVFLQEMRFEQERSR